MEQADETIKLEHGKNGKFIRPVSIISIFMLFLSLFPTGVFGLPGGSPSIFIPAIMNGYGNAPLTPITDLGSIKYTLDTARQATATYKNDGNSVTLSVTTPRGTSGP